MLKALTFSWLDHTFPAGFSEDMCVDAWHKEASYWQIQTHEGELMEPAPNHVAPSCPTESGVGQLIRFSPTTAVFDPSVRLTQKQVREILASFAASHRGVRIKLHDLRGVPQEFIYENGWLDWLRERSPGSSECFTFDSEGHWQHAGYQVAIQHSSSANDGARIYGFLNHKPLNLGAHVTGLKRAIKSVPKWRELPRGLSAVIAVESQFAVRDTRFGNHRLTDSDIEAEIELTVGKRLRELA